MKLEFGYGNGVQTVEVPERNLMAVLTANEIEHVRMQSIMLWSTLSERLN